MEENPPPESEEPTPEPPTSSLASKLLNVYAAPAEVFDEIAGRPPQHNHWVIPLVLGCLVAVVSVWVMFSQPDLIQQMQEAQEAQLQKQVDEGNMTQEQMDQALAGMNQFMTPRVLKIGGSVGAVLAAVAFLLLIALGIWFILRILFKAKVGYTKILEVTGLAGMISVLGGVVGLLVILITGKMNMTLSPALFVEDFDPTNNAHAMLAALNVMTLWYLGVLSLGSARVSERPVAQIAPWIFGAWLVIRVGGIFLS